MMGNSNSNSYPIFLVFCFLMLTFLQSHVIAEMNGKHSIGIIIGAGGVGNGSKHCTAANCTQPSHFRFQFPRTRRRTPTPPPLAPPVSASLPPLVPELLTFVDQRLALVYPVIQKFKATITSDPLGVTKTWVGSDICSYRGFYCDSPPDNKTATALASIDFNGFQLEAPTLDGFLDQLPDIALFHANSNFFSGVLSPDIAKLPYLYEFDISNNRFSGLFPMPVLAMPGLTFLDIRFNYFTGSVPPQIFALNLDVLFINNNNFTQNLPDNLEMSRILYLTLANNNFMGPIPKGISKALSGLTEILLLNNMLSGCVPSEIGLLDEATVFDAGNNRLTGPLPVSLACLEKVEQLNFAGNLLYGMVPDEVCALGRLANLSLSGNYFTQIGPLCRRLMWRGAVDIRNNCIPDLPYQRSVEECADFFAHPLVCPYTNTYSFVPCELSHFSSPHSSAP